MHRLLSDDQSFEYLQFIKFNTLRLLEDKTISLCFWLLKVIAIKSTQIWIISLSRGDRLMLLGVLEGVIGEIMKLPQGCAIATAQGAL